MLNPIWSVMVLALPVRERNSVVDIAVERLKEGRRSPNFVSKV